jgi:hypothetical protein
VTILEAAIRLGAIWILTYSITSLHGPFKVFEKLRTKYPIGGLLLCPICLSVWIGVAIAYTPYGKVLEGIGIAGIAMLAHGLAGWRFGGG